MRGLARKGFSRRALLRSLGASSALLPFLPVLDGEAQAAGFPKRLILFYWPIGTVLPKWRCSGGEHDFELSPILSPLERHRDKLLILDGIDHEVASHQGNMIGHPGLVAFWTGIAPLAGDFKTCTASYGWAGGPSVDQVVADAYAGQTPLRSLDLGVMLEQNDYALPYSRQSYRAANQPVTPIEDMAEAFDYIFGNVNIDPEAGERIRKARQSVMDSVYGDLSALQKRLGGGERAKMEAHLDNLRTIEHRLESSVGANCNIPERPATGYCKYNALSDCNEAVNSTMFDLMASALRCDLTRVIGFQAATEGSGPHFPQNQEYGDPHTISHMADETGLAMQTEITTWWMDQLAQLLDRLASTPEGDGTLLDNTLVVTGSCAGDSWYHGNRNLPMLLAGGAGGGVTPGRYLRFGSYDVNTPSRDPHGGRTMNDLLISICHAMGLTDVDTFGYPDYCTGPIGELL